MISQCAKRGFLMVVFVLSLILSLVSITNAATTIGTNFSTTGTMTVTPADDSATSVRFQNAAGTNIFIINSTNQWVGVGAAPQTTFEVQGTASASYLLTGNTLQAGGNASAAYNRFGTSATGHSNYISSSNDVLISGDLEVRATASFGSVASVSGMFYLVDGRVKPGLGGDSTTAFRFQNAAGSATILTIDTTNTRVGVGKTPSTTFDVSGSASVSLNFEAGGYASASTGFFQTGLIVGNNTASSSATYVAEFGNSKTGTASFYLGGGNSATKGTCFQLKSTTGEWIYMRFNQGATTPTLSTIRCH